ncbi:MAG: fused MFS/spermidine synthase [Sedimentisphaerales bacterium]|nr:fused MFS/spermidine synthase [Sedimentisphaerales bacterium]
MGQKQENSETPQKTFKSLFIPSATVFMSSFCIMTLELVAGRLIARHLGSSLYTWTAVIGVVLAGITIGNYIGGRIADRFPTRKALACLFCISSVACVIIIFLNNLIGEWIWLWKLSWPVRTFTHVSLVFLLPSLLLGTISPVVAKMALDQGHSTGRTVGDIYAWGAAGSIAGTFATGYFLVNFMGTVAIVWTVAGSLLVLGLLYWVRFWMAHIWLILFIFSAILGLGTWDWAKNAGASVALREKISESTLYEDETPYCYVAVNRLSNNPDRREFIQDKLRHSEIIIGELDNLQYFYTHIFAGVTHGISQQKKTMNMMVIGGGGYVFPQYLHYHWPDSRIDVVEIDPGVTEAAIQAFGLPRDSPINTITMDARNYIDELLIKKRSGDEIVRYDLIFEDAINDYSVPYQLVTKEFNEKIVDVLSDDGVYLLNLIDFYNHGLFLGGIVNTLKQSFPYVYVATSDITHASLRETFVVISSMQPLDLNKIFSEYYQAPWDIWQFNEEQINDVVEKSKGIIFTDDYVPVENLLAPVVRQSAREILSHKYLQQAEDFKQQSQWQKSIEHFQLAVENNPSMAIKAYNDIGFIEASLGNMDKALQAYQKAVDFYEETGAKQKVIGSIYLNMATVYQRMGNNLQAKEMLDKAVAEFKVEVAQNPDSAILWTRLGDALAISGNLREASIAFQNAIDREPGNLLYYDNLIKSLEYQRRYEEAIDALQKGVDYFNDQGQKENALKLSNYLDAIKYRNSQLSR